MGYIIPLYDEAVSTWPVTVETFQVARLALELGLLLQVRAFLGQNLGRALGREAQVDEGGADIGDILLNASYRKTEADTPGGFAGVFGHIANLYFQRYGDQSAAMAAIAAKNHHNGVENPYAQLRKDFGFEFCLQLKMRKHSSTTIRFPSSDLAALLLFSWDILIRFDSTIL